jgi:hypothetical protein
MIIEIAIITGRKRVWSGVGGYPPPYSLGLI